jgi:hypothetical protein
MDSHTFRRAWDRAIAWQRDGDLPDLQDAEMATLNVLWSVRCAQQTAAADDELDRDHALSDVEDQRRDEWERAR